jgi:hypothetical protein
MLQSCEQLHVEYAEMLWYSHAWPILILLNSSTVIISKIEFFKNKISYFLYQIWFFVKPRIVVKRVSIRS